MKIALLQTQTGRDAQANIAQLENLLQKAEQAEIVVTPECTNILGFDPARDQLATMADDAVTNYLRDYAKAHQQNIIIGSALLYDPSRGGNVNRQIVINQNGEITRFYDKIHMFDVSLPSGETYRESERFVAGETAKNSKFEGVSFGHSICFDLRFAALYRKLAEAGAEVLLVPAAFTALTGKAHWRPLLRARAIETGAFVVAPGQCGSFQHHDGSKRLVWGHSMVISPWGEVLGELDESPDCLIVEIDIAAVQAARAQIPSLTAARDFKWGEA